MYFYTRFWLSPSKCLNSQTVLCLSLLISITDHNMLLNTRSTAKNLCNRRDHNLSAWNQYFRQSCMSYSIESQSYVNLRFQSLIG